MFHLTLNQTAPAFGRTFIRNGLCAYPSSMPSQTRSVSSNGSDDDAHSSPLTKWTNVPAKPVTGGWKSMSTLSWASGNIFADILQTKHESPRESPSSTRSSSPSASSDAYVCTCHGNVRCFNCLHARLRVIEDDAKSNTRISAPSLPWTQLSCVFEPEPEATKTATGSTNMDEVVTASRKVKRARRKSK